MPSSTKRIVKNMVAKDLPEKFKVTKLLKSE